MQNKKGIGKKIGGFFLKTLAFLLTGVLALAVTLLLTLNMLCSDAYPSVQRTFVTGDGAVEIFGILVFVTGRNPGNCRSKFDAGF